MVERRADVGAGTGATGVVTDNGPGVVAWAGWVMAVASPGDASGGVESATGVGEVEDPAGGGTPTTCIIPPTTSAGTTCNT